jgi:hypothetical protein
MVEVGADQRIIDKVQERADVLKSAGDPTIAACVYAGK